MLLTVQQQDAQALRAGLKAQTSQQVVADIQALSSSLSEALNGEYSKAFSESEIENLLENQVQTLVSHKAAKENKANAKTTLQHKKKHHKKHHHHAEPKHPQGHPVAKPAARNLISIKEKAQDFSQSLDVPIDEVKAINLKVSPTFDRDHVESVTLKSFRKVVGYDTFNSILKKDRDEAKDEADYYNITVSMMVKRIPEEGKDAEPYKNADGKSLAQSLDKGFPYDDGDNSIDDQVPLWRQINKKSGTNVGSLNGENITKEALKNLVTDRNAPITAGLVQLGVEKSDSDILSSLLGENVTRGHLKNLITDKPAPITVALAQKTAAPAAPAGSAPVAPAGGAPAAPAGGAPAAANDTLGLKMTVGGDKVSVAQQLSQGVPVHVNPVLMQD
jgi:hypothetical protein